MSIQIDGDLLTLEQFDRVARGKKRVELSPAAEKSGLQLL
jgi:hypothetical protein